MTQLQKEKEKKSSCKNSMIFKHLKNNVSRNTDIHQGYDNMWKINSYCTIEDIYILRLEINNSVEKNNCKLIKYPLFTF